MQNEYHNRVEFSIHTKGSVENAESVCPIMGFSPGVLISLVCCCLVAKSCLTLWEPLTVACQASLSMGLPRQGYWSGLPFPPPGDLPDPGIEPVSPALSGRLFTDEPPERTTHHPKCSHKSDRWLGSWLLLGYLPWRSSERTKGKGV